MATNHIPDTEGNARIEKSGGRKMNKNPVIGEAHTGPDPHASKTHKKYNRHHGMKHAFGKVLPETNAGSKEITTEHEGPYCCDGNE